MQALRPGAALTVGVVVLATHHERLVVLAGALLSPPAGAASAYGAFAVVAARGS